jgi:hypothetical protein
MGPKHILIQPLVSSWIPSFVAIQSHRYHTNGHHHNTNQPPARERYIGTKLLHGSDCFDCCDWVSDEWS